MDLEKEKRITENLKKIFDLESIAQKFEKYSQSDKKEIDTRRIDHYISLNEKESNVSPNVLSSKFSY